MYNRNNRRGMSRRSSYRISAANNVEKAIALLLSAEYKTSKNNDIYDFLYGSWSLGEAEQLAPKRQVEQALRHYEDLEYEMDYKSRKLNEGLRGRRSASSYKAGLRGKTAKDANHLIWELGKERKELGKVFAQILKNMDEAQKSLINEDTYSAMVAMEQCESLADELGLANLLGYLKQNARRVHEIGSY